MPSIGVGLCHWDLCVSRCCPPDWTQEEMKPRDRQELACSVVRTRICVHIWLQKPQRFLWLEVCSSPSESLICHFWYLMGFIYNLMVLVVNLVLNPTCKSNTNKVLSVHSIFKLSLEILNSYTVISYIRVRIRWFPSSLLLLTMVFGCMSMKRYLLCIRQKHLNENYMVFDPFVQTSFITAVWWYPSRFLKTVYA